MTYSYLDELAGHLYPEEDTGPPGSIVVYTPAECAPRDRLVLGRFWFDSGLFGVSDTELACQVVGQGIIHNSYTFTPLCGDKPIRRKGIGVRVDVVMRLDAPSLGLVTVIRTRSVRTKAGESIIGGTFHAQPLLPDGSVDLDASAQRVVAHQLIAPVTHDWLMEKFEWYRTYCTPVVVHRPSTS